MKARTGNTLPIVFVVSFGAATVIWVILCVLMLSPKQEPLYSDTNEMSHYAAIANMANLGEEFGKSLLTAPAHTIRKTDFFDTTLVYSTSGETTAVNVNPLEMPALESAQKHQDRRLIENSKLRMTLSSFSVPIKVMDFDDQKYFREMELLAFQLDPRFKRTTHETMQQSLDALQEIFGAWADFCDQNQVPYWIAHSTLFGWKWGRRMVPWEHQIEIHLPANLLYDLEHYDGQVIASKVKLYLIKYLFEINPHHKYRKAQENNVVDARLIDKQSGHFIDIFGISMIEYPRLQTKNGITYDYEWIFPLIRTTFHGIYTWRPSNYTAILEDEYGHYRLNNELYDQYKFEPTRNEWRHIKDCHELHSVYIAPRLNPNYKEEYPKFIWVNRMRGSKGLERCGISRIDSDHKVVSFAAFWYDSYEVLPSLPAKPVDDIEPSSRARLQKK